MAGIAVVSPEAAPMSAQEARMVTAQESALRRLIEREREALDASLGRLSSHVKDSLDWRQQVSRHRKPLLAAAGGLALAALWRMRRRRSPMDRAAEAIARGAREVTDYACDTLSDVGRLASITHKVPRVVLAPLIAAGVQAAVAHFTNAGRAECDVPPESE
jgi:hypothetical protein